MRGEQLAPRIKKLVSLGSPPLARGTDVVTEPELKKLGITPACAGNRMMMGFPEGWTRDHPRLRGEQFFILINFHISGGSPPLARGTVHCGDVQSHRTGITPACAGNRIVPALKSTCRQDHPRLRGEQAYAVYHRPPKPGSPPLARGTVALAFFLVLDKGITPACAGNRRKHAGGRGK